MGVTTRYLGHVTITPRLDQAEYDHLRAVSRGEVPLVGPDELEPWCPWEPCAHGCCLRWSGSDSHGTGAEGLQLLIDRFLSPDDRGAPIDSLDDPELPGLTFDHDTNGVIACEDGERGLFLLRVDHGRVRVEMLLGGDPSPWELGLDAAERLPWLSPEPTPEERNRLFNEATLAAVRASLGAEGG
ncbi:hypothetical protein GCM10022197_42720 [Microlunatus spumicola]|uniref:Uncharacterized protein n=1 Tax=Microlunatus spumicola TaxID=81499 RepID=A0ABP6YFP6_9ACTN